VKLRPHQIAAQQYLEDHDRAYLADQPRVGKTPPAILAARALDIQSTLVVCPASVVGNWEREWTRWWPAGPRPMVVSYDKLARMDTTRIDPDLVILDEAHYIKTRTAKRTKAALAVLKRARRKWLLSGTPAPNNPSELYVPLAALWPEELKALGIRHAEDWLNYSCHWQRIQVGPRIWVPKVFAAKNVERIRALLARCMLRRTFAEVSGKEPVWWSEQVITLPGVTTKWINDETPAGEPSEENLAKIRHEIGKLKAPVVGAILAEELRDEPFRKIVVVAYHRAVLVALYEALLEFQPLMIDGSTPKGARDARVTLFQTQHKHRVLLGQHKAIREGITLDRADEVVMVELVFTPGDNEQVANRASSTEKPTVPVRVFSVRDTVDEALNAVIVRKEEMQSGMGL